MIDAGSERVRPRGGPGFSEWVSVAWGDLEAERFGLARLGLAPGPTAGPRGRARWPSSSRAARWRPASWRATWRSSDPDWSALRVGPLAMETA